MVEHLYKIGKVADLTGLSVERLRMWEQRHAIQATAKVNRIRFYDDDLLTKLTLIKELIDHGYSIGELKDLSVKELKPLLGRRPGSVDQPSELGIVLVGDTWNFEDSSTTPQFDVAARFLTIESFCEWSSNEVHVKYDALVLLVSSLDIERVTVASALTDVPVFVVYKYATESDLDSARNTNIFVAKLPEMNWQTLVDVIEEQLVNEDDTFPVYRFFDDEQLDHLRRCKTNGRIEPENLVEIVYLQRAIVDHLSRTTDSALDIAVVEAVKAAENSIERALQSIADKHQLLV